MIERETDFSTWADSMSYVLTERCEAISAASGLSATDVDHIAEEIADLSAKEKRQLRKQLARLLSHLLKWKYQPAMLYRHGSSWRKTIRNSRNEISDVLKFSPGLSQYLAEWVVDLYPRAVVDASDQTGIAPSAFPATCPWTVEQIMQSEPWVFEY